MIFDNGDIYIGQFENDNISGYGLLVKRNEFKLVGQFKDNKLEGV